MPTEFDTKFRKVGLNLVNKFGVTTGSYSAANRTPVSASDILDSGGQIDNTPDTQSITMTPPLRYSKGDIDGNTIQSHDMYVIISGEHWDAAFTGQPETNDSIIVNSLDFVVINPNPIYSGEQIAAYKIQLRRGQ